MSPSTAGLQPVGAAPPGASCWICLDDGPGDFCAGEDDVLMRGCACRGDSGWVHTSCLAGYLSSKSKSLYNKANREEILDSERTEFERVWYSCSQCKQEFKGEQFLALAETRFKEVVVSDFSEDDRRYLSAMYFKAEGMLNSTRHSSRGLETVESLLPVWTILDEYLRIISESESDGLYLIHFEIDGLYLLAAVLKRMAEGEEGTSDKVIARGKEILQQCKQLADRHPDSSCVKDQCDQVSLIVGSKVIGGKGNLAEATAYWRKTAKREEEIYGPDHERSFSGQAVLAESLFEEGKIHEAVALMQKTLDHSKRVMGPDDPIVERLQDKLSFFQIALLQKQVVEPGIGHASLVSDNPNLNGKAVIIIRRAKGHEDKFVVKMGETKVKVVASKLIFSHGTPVTMKDLVKASHLNGRKAEIESFDKKMGRYVLIRKDGKKVMVKPGNIIAHS